MIIDQTPAILNSCSNVPSFHRIGVAGVGCPRQASALFNWGRRALMMSALLGTVGLLSGSTKDVLETALEAEMSGPSDTPRNRAHGELLWDGRWCRTSLDATVPKSY